jgi:DNA-binding transcriptional MerR regulator
MSDEYMSSTEVCRYLQFSSSVLNKLDKNGTLKPKRRLPSNNKRLYAKEDVDNFLNSISEK